MDVALLIGLACLALAATIVLAVVRPRPVRLLTWRRAAVVVAAAVAIAAVVRAETPFGIGDGVVPALVGEDRCASEQVLAKRGLHWRYGRDGRVRRRPCDRVIEDDGMSCPDTVERQRPAAGADLGERGLVELRTTFLPARGVGCG